MRKVNLSLCSRLVLSLTAVFAVISTGVVFAGSPDSSYPTPKYAAILGPSTVSVDGGTGNYTLFVTFVNGTTADITYPTCTFSVGGGGGSFTGGTYTSSSTPGKVLIKATFSTSNGSVTSSRVITVM